MVPRPAPGNPGILRSMRPPRWLIEVVETLGLTLITFFVIQSFVAQPFQVRQTSMERTLEPDQYVLVDKLTPRFDPFQRGDIVVLHPPEGWDDEQGTPFIKRVIGLPGETVAIGDDGERVRQRGGPRRGPATRSRATTARTSRRCPSRTRRPGRWRRTSCS